MAELEGDLEDTQSEFRQLDDKMARVGRVATQVGARLQVRGLQNPGSPSRRCASNFGEAGLGPETYAMDPGSQPYIPSIETGDA